MMLHIATIKRWVLTTCIAGAATMLTGCSLMDVDRDHCPQGLNIDFVYDYNAQQANMFPDHVGGITLYVFDEDGKLVTSRTAAKSKPETLIDGELRFQIDDLEAGNYTLLATAMQRDYDEASARPGAKFRIQRPATGQGMDALSITLDHDATNAVVHQGEPLDTLWTALEPVSVTLDNYHAAFATVPLMRHTKHIHLSLLQTESPETLSHEDYEVSITAANSTINHDNSLVSTPTLLYTPYVKWTSSLATDDTNQPATTNARAQSVLDHTAHYELCTSRLLYDATPRNIITVRNRSTGEVVFSYDLARLLANGRDAYELQQWGPQEYLDREYDYDLHLVLSGNRWDNVTLNIGILGWSKRIQNVDL